MQPATRPGSSSRPLSRRSATWQTRITCSRFKCGRTTEAGRPQHAQPSSQLREAISSCSCTQRTLPGVHTRPLSPVEVQKCWRRTRCAVPACPRTRRWIRFVVMSKDAQMDPFHCCIPSTRQSRVHSFIAVERKQRSMSPLPCFRSPGCCRDDAADPAAVLAWLVAVPSCTLVVMDNQFLMSGTASSLRGWHLPQDLGRCLLYNHVIHYHPSLFISTPSLLLQPSCQRSLLHACLLPD